MQLYIDNKLIIERLLIHIQVLTFILYFFKQANYKSNNNNRQQKYLHI